MPKEPLVKVVKRRLYGLIFIVVVVALVSLSILIYNKAFTDTVDVTLKTNHIGNQLLLDSDVKVRGLIVGSVASVDADGNGATVQLSLQPNRVSQIPKNVSAQILPKTLFGEQYVSLMIPKKPAGPIAANDVIAQDVSKGALEAQTVLDHLYPLLTAVQPAELNSTLTAIATALHDRGKKLGTTLVNMDTYLRGLNPSAKTLVEDLKKLGRVSLEYNNVAPDIFDSLQNLQTSVKTVVEKQQGFDDLLTTGADTSVVLRGFLADNKQRLITVNAQNNKIYPLLAQYSPEFPCLFAGVNKLDGLANDAIYDNQIHLSIVADTTNQGKYVPGEQPRLVTGLGPNCFGLPNNPTPTVDGKFQIPDGYRCINDGAALTEDACAQRSATSASYAAIGSPEENAVVNTLIAGEMGTTPAKVPAAATILAGPLLRGQKVVLK